MKSEVCRDIIVYDCTRAVSKAVVINLIFFLKRLYSHIYYQQRNVIHVVLFYIHKLEHIEYFHFNSPSHLTNTYMYSLINVFINKCPLCDLVLTIIKSLF